MHRRGFLSELIGAAVRLLMTVVMGALVLTTTVIAGMVREILRIYWERAFQPTAISRVLWIALGTLLIICLLAALAAGSVIAPGSAVLVGITSFLVLFLVAEVCDWRVGPQDHERRRFDMPGLLQFHPATPWSWQDRDPNREGSFEDGVVVGEDENGWH